MPEIPNTVPPPWKHLIEACMHADPSKRPPFKDILEVLDSLTGTASAQNTHAHTSLYSIYFLIKDFSIFYFLIYSTSFSSSPSSTTH